MWPVFLLVSLRLSLSSRLNIVLEERGVYVRERHNGLCDCSDLPFLSTVTLDGALPFALANTLVHIPSLFSCALLVSLICYWAIGERSCFLDLNACRFPARNTFFSLSCTFSSQCSVSLSYCWRADTSSGRKPMRSCQPHSHDSLADLSSSRVGTRFHCSFGPCLFHERGLCVNFVVWLTTGKCVQGYFSGLDPCLASGTTAFILWIIRSE